MLLSLAFLPFCFLLPLSFLFISSRLLPPSLSLSLPLPPAGRTVTCNGLLNDFAGIELHVPAAEQHTQRG
jgi:hypothetical protein